MSNVIKNKKPRTKAAYSAPKIKNLGRISVVTQKSGTPYDSNQTTKPGGGVG